MHLYRCVDKLFQTSESSASKRIGAVAANLTSDIQIGRTFQKEILSTKCEKIVSSTKNFSLPSNFRTKIISMMIHFSFHFRTKTNYVVHKTTSYIIVLSLLMSDRYEMDIQNIIEEVGIPKKDLFKIINSIAVRPKAKTSVVSIRLPSQLRPFSTSFQRRRTL